MKTWILTPVASLLAASTLLGADLEVVMMVPEKGVASPLIVDPGSPVPLMVPFSQQVFDLLTTDDPTITPRIGKAETRIIHGAKEDTVYKVVPESVGLNGYQNLEFSFRRQEDGTTDIDLVWVSGRDRTKAGMTFEDEDVSHLVVELRHLTNGRILFCALGVGGDENAGGQPDQEGEAEDG